MTEIGKTRSGKVIFAEAKASKYKGWTFEDHMDAFKRIKSYGLDLKFGSPEESLNYNISQSHRDTAVKLSKLKRPRYDI